MNNSRLLVLRVVLWVLSALCLMLIWVMVARDAGSHDPGVTWEPVNEEIAEAIHEKEGENGQEAIIPSFPININQANAEQLQHLPGIGPSKAQAIVLYRESHGHFKEKKELMQVKGIGSKTYEQLEGMIIVNDKADIFKDS